MLTRLQIDNIVLFEKVSADFTSGLNVITGETGAGKSLLLQALDLALGARGDSSLLRQGASFASVSAEFEALPEALVAELGALGIAQEDSLIIRRSLSPEGKTKAWVNDVQVTQTALKQLAGLLIERHGQHDQRGLMDSKNHRDLLDAHLASASVLSHVKTAYAALASAQRDLASTHEMLANSAREEAYQRMIIEDLGRLNPSAGEEEALVEARTRYMALQKNQSALEAVLAEIEGQRLVRDALIAAQRQIMRASLDAAMQEKLSAALERAVVEVDDVSAEVSALLHQPGEDEASLSAKEDRLFALRAAARKFHTTPEALPEMLIRAREHLRVLDDGEAALRRAEKQCEAARADYLAACGALSEAREKAAAQLIKAAQKELAALSMADAKLRIARSVLPEHQWGEAGCESVVFEIAPNKGQGFEPLHKIASGGELSRLMLAISVVLNPSDRAACVIYDEIDAGTSGAVAEAIGVRLKKLSAQQQVLVITHLPQVAACANHHVLMEKHASARHTYTTLRMLSKAEREAELARLMSGKVVTSEAKKAATKLLQAAS